MNIHKNSEYFILNNSYTMARVLAAHQFTKAQYINPSSWFLADDGTIRDGLYGNDYVHLVPAGYKVAARYMADLIR